MTGQVRVALGDRGYDILIGGGLLERAGEFIARVRKPRRVFVVTDANVAGSHLPRLEGGLRAAGIAASAIVRPPGEGAKIKCEVGPGKKGPQVVRVHEVDGKAGAGGGAAGGPPRPRAGFRERGAGGGARERDDVDMTGAADVEGVVKWYSPEKGYGFVTSNDGGKDIFVNAACLRRSGVPSIDTDVACRTTYVTTPRGREARYIRVIVA